MQKLKIWLYFIITLLWISGLTFFILKTWFQIPGEFGITTNPYQYTALQVHGFFALIMMVTFGYVLGTHVPKVFKLKPTRILGILLVTVVSFQIITAYLLYYIVEDFARDVVEYLHLGAGISLPFILIFHIYRNKLLKTKNK